MKNLYLAAPLFNPQERALNEEVCQRLELYGYNVYLPQRDGGRAEMGDSITDLFRCDLYALKECDVMVAICQGATLDEGTVFEIGYAIGQGKSVFIYRDDWRSFSKTQDLNLMLSQSCYVYQDLEGIYKALNR